MAELTEQQKRFADNFVESGNASDAYTKAGYKVKSADVAKVNASRLLTNANVRNYIEQRNKQLESRRIADMSEVKEFWTSTLRDAEADRKDRLKASEYIAKTNGAFIDKMDIGNKDGIPFQTSSKHDLSGLSVEELKQLERIVSKTTATD